MGTRERGGRTGVLLAVIALSCLLLFQGGWEAAEAAEENPGHPVDIAGVVILRVRVPVEDRDPLEQAAVIYQRWVRVLEVEKENLSPDLVRIEEIEEGIPGIYVGSVLLIEVDEGNARANATTPNGLAEVWASNLRRAIARYMEIHGM